MPHFALVYEFVDNFAERRTPFREAHLRVLRDAQTRGFLIMSGPLGDPPDGALLICRADLASNVESFALVTSDVFHAVVAHAERVLVQEVRDLSPILFQQIFQSSSMRLEPSHWSTYGSLSRFKSKDGWWAMPWLVELTRRAASASAS